MITDKEIIKDLQEKEQSLEKQLAKVRAALSVYMNDYKIDVPVHFPAKVQQSANEFDQYMSNDQRVIFALRNITSGVVDNIVDTLIKLGDETERDRLYNGITGAASRLYRKGLLRADTRGKKYRYSLSDGEEFEKERAEILPYN